jgi:hypothetical protein
MAIKVNYVNQGALHRRLGEIRAAADPRSYPVKRLRAEITAAVVEDNTEKILGRGLLEGVDRYGRPLAPMADSTFRNRRRGFGPVLAPRGLLSRVITTFKVRWAFVGGQWRMSAGWVDFLSKGGYPIMLAHLDGCPKGSNARRPSWSLPKRDVGGISPKGWVKVQQAFASFRARLAGKGA